MLRWSRWLCRHLAAVAAVLIALQASLAFAHLMQAQRGTINFASDGAFLVISIPVSALKGVDDDGDGRLSARELRSHYSEIESQIAQGLLLQDRTGPRPLQGLMLNLSPPDNDPTGPAPQLVVLGRFALAANDATYRFKIDIFGAKPEESSYQITATRGDATQLLVLSASRPAMTLFASAWSVFADYTKLGTEHILLGFDHLLFLLVVLAAGWTWRQVLLALTAFTLGHCVTLVISVWGGVNVPATIVEPAIAATIVGMALYDLRKRQLDAAGAVGTVTATGIPWRRMLAVFACALIHGLGLGATLVELGLDSTHRLTSLAGFNLGIELGQLAVAAVAGLVLIGIRRALGARSVRLATGFASVMGVVIGGVWFVQRMIEGL
jgi:hypothetical protein